MRKVPTGVVSPPRWLKPMNKILMAIRRVGGMKELSVLTVVGRTSGKRRSTPLTVVEVDDESYLLEGFPGADWARNVRAARGEADLSVGRTTNRVRLVELTSAAAEPILRIWPARAGTDGPKIMKDAGVVDEVTPEAFAALAGTCAVFRIDFPDRSLQGTIDD
nr:nitroreductase/quinone reductase family protein [Rhodococcus sp. (in: high G+C Gram-positive bacteria)]